jgi:hypothetical protein
MPEWLIIGVVLASVLGLAGLRKRKLGRLPPTARDERDERELAERNQAVAELRASIAGRTGENLLPDDTMGGHLLVTFDGIGVALYSFGDVDAVSGTYAATKWFTVLYVPVIPLGRFRVLQSSEALGWRRSLTSYTIVGKLPLRMIDWLIPVVCWGTFAVIAKLIS